MNSYICTATVTVLVIAPDPVAARNRMSDIIGTEPSITEVIVELEEENVDVEEEE